MLRVLIQRTYCCFHSTRRKRLPMLSKGNGACGSTLSDSFEIKLTTNTITLTGGMIPRQTKKPGYIAMLPEVTAPPVAPLAVEHTFEDEVCYELSLQLAENLADVGAIRFLREIRTTGGTWLVTAVRV